MISEIESALVPFKSLVSSTNLHKLSLNLLTGCIVCKPITFSVFDKFGVLNIIQYNPKGNSTKQPLSFRVSTNFLKI